MHAFSELVIKKKNQHPLELFLSSSTTYFLKLHLLFIHLGIKSVFLFEIAGFFFFLFISYNNEADLGTF